MCGIYGVYRVRGAFDPSEVARDSLELLRHRGPDGAGWRVGARGALGFRRLAIIDVAGGAQPLHDEESGLSCVVNGEIYNHRELRARLADRHLFQSGSDAEVVLHGYKEWGEAIFSALRGMFAIALLDHRRDRLTLVRDRVGKKPLYYRVLGDDLRFSSEPEPLLEGAPTPIDRGGLNDYLRFGYVPAPRTMYQGVYKLPAGCLLTAFGPRMSVHRWAPPLAIQAEENGDAGRWADDLRQALDEAVRVRLESEVPLGFLLSGGVDSAAVFALGAAALGPGVRAFTIGFDDAEVDERGAAAAVAARYQARHDVHILGEGEGSALGDAVARGGEPVATDALLPTDRVFRAVRAAGITTVLTGEGSDEIFAGYAKFEHALDHDGWSASGQTALSRYLSREEFCFSSLAERRLLLGAAATDEGFEWLEEVVEPLDPLSQMLALEVELRLPDRINHRLDRLSMAWSVEARAPFMDLELMRLALRVPHALRRRPGVSKWILRRAMEQRLPREILGAPKAPFRAPQRWFSPTPNETLIDPTALPRLRTRAAHGERRATEQLYSLTVLELWLRRQRERGLVREVPRA